MSQHFFDFLVLCFLLALIRPTNAAATKHLVKRGIPLDDEPKTKPDENANNKTLVKRDTDAAAADGAAPAATASPGNPPADPAAAVPPADPAAAASAAATPAAAAPATAAPAAVAPAAAPSDVKPAGNVKPAGTKATGPATGTPTREQQIKDKINTAVTAIKDKLQSLMKDDEDSSEHHHHRRNPKGRHHSRRRHHYISDEQHYDKRQTAYSKRDEYKQEKKQLESTAGGFNANINQNNNFSPSFGNVGDIGSVAGRGIAAANESQVQISHREFIQLEQYLDRYFNLLKRLILRQSERKGPEYFFDFRHFYVPYAYPKSRSFDDLDDDSSGSSDDDSDDTSFGSDELFGRAMTPQKKPPGWKKSGGQKFVGKKPAGPKPTTTTPAPDAGAAPTDAGAASPDAGAAPPETGSALLDAGGPEAVPIDGAK